MQINEVSISMEFEFNFSGRCFALGAHPNHLELRSAPCLPRPLLCSHSLCYVLQLFVSDSDIATTRALFCSREITHKLITHLDYDFAYSCVERWGLVLPHFRSKYLRLIIVWVVQLINDARNSLCEPNTPFI